MNLKKSEIRNSLIIKHSQNGAEIPQNEAEIPQNEAEIPNILHLIVKSRREPDVK